MFTGGWDFDVDNAIFVEDCPGKAAKAGHIDVCIEDGEESELGEQQESGDGIICDLRIYGDAELSQGALEGDEKENTVQTKLKPGRMEWDRNVRFVRDSSVVQYQSGELGKSVDVRDIKVMNRGAAERKLGEKEKAIWLSEN